MLRKFLLYVLPYKLVVWLTKTRCAGSALIGKYDSRGTEKQYKIWFIDEDNLLLQREWEINKTEKQKKKEQSNLERKLNKAERKSNKSHREYLMLKNKAEKG